MESDMLDPRCPVTLPFSAPWWLLSYDQKHFILRRKVRGQHSRPTSEHLRQSTEAFLGEAERLFKKKLFKRTD